MGKEEKKIEILKEFRYWAKCIQKDISHFGRDFERAFCDELESDNDEIIALLDNLDDFYSNAESLKEFSENLIEMYEED